MDISMKSTTISFKIDLWKGKAPMAAWLGLLAGLGLFTMGADKTNDIISPGTSLPIGVIVPFAGPTNQVPERAGWLLCDGRELSVSEYGPLFACLEYAWGKGGEANAFRIPDLRGRFLRGVDHTPDNESRDPDRKSRHPSFPGGNAGNQVGSIQEDELKEHRHSLQGSAWSIGNGVPGTAQLLRFHSAKSPDENAPEYANDLPVHAAGGSETRPKNAYVNWIIKVK